MRVLSCVLLLCLLSCAAVSAAMAPQILLGPKADPIEHQAALELQRYVYSVTGTVFEIASADTPSAARAAVVLGTDASLPDVGAPWPFGLEAPRNDGYVIYTARRGPALIVIAAATPAGVRNGVFGWLESLGFGFYLSGDVLPASVSGLANLDLPEYRESHSPTFAVRGAIPWDSYLVGSATWSLADYKAYIDQLVHMRCNYVAFHADETTPFAAFEYQDAYVGGAPLPSAKDTVWGTPLASQDFYAGTARFFGRPYFGAPSTELKKREAAIREAKETLAKAMDYAKTRGLRVGFGFEVKGDPLNAETQSCLDTQLRAVLHDYPALDTLWLWEPRGFAQFPSPMPSNRSLWASFTRHWEETLAPLKTEEEKAEAARMGLVALQAKNVLEAIRPDVTLVLSGWGGEDPFQFTSFLPSMDQILPRDVVFSALDDAPMSDSVSDQYEALHVARQRWPILHWEFDGDLWMPQPNLAETAGACRDALDKGCQGLLGVHWRTREPEETATFCARFAWNPELTVEQFCAQRARELAGTEHADFVAQQLLALQDLGYRWVGGTGQNMSDPFTWTVGDYAKRTRLARIGYDLQTLGTAPSSRFTDLSRDVVDTLTLRKPAGFPKNLEHLIDTIDYVLAYDAAAARLAPDTGLDELAENGDTETVVSRIRESRLADALYRYARGMRTKGELAVLASINTRAWADLQDRLGLDDAAIAALTALPANRQPEDTLLMLPDRIILPGDTSDNPRLTLRYRTLEKQSTHTHSLDLVGGHTFAFVFPRDLTGEAFEYGVDRESKRSGITLSLNSSAAKGLPHTAVMIKTESISAPEPPKATSPAAPNVAVAIDPQHGAVELTWDPRPGMAYTVLRDGTDLGTVYTGFFEDDAAPSDRTAVYIIREQALASDAAAEMPLSVQIPALPLPEPPAEVDVTTRGGQAAIGWYCNDPLADTYRVTQRDQQHALVAEWNVRAAYSHYQETSAPVEANSGYTFSVSPVTSDGRTGLASSPVGVIASGKGLAPLLALSFSQGPSAAALARLADLSLAVGGPGWPSLAKQRTWDPETELTIVLWVKFSELIGKPVLICKGPWSHSAYYLQVRNGQYRFALAGLGVLQGGEPVLDQWQHLVATYVRGEMRLYLNGEPVARRYVPQDTTIPADTNNMSGDAHVVRGLLDGIHVYGEALTPEEIAAQANADRPKY